MNMFYSTHHGIQQVTRASAVKTQVDYVPYALDDSGRDG